MQVYKRGSKGNGVTQLQNDLIKLGFNFGKYGADGSYGPATEKTVKEFQRKYNLQVDGIAGPATQGKIEDLLKQKENAQNDGKLYKVQVGAFTQRENAEKLKKEMQALGYKPFIKIE